MNDKINVFIPNILERIDKLIAFATVKASLLLPANVVLISFLFKSQNLLIIGEIEPSNNLLRIVLMFLGLIFSIVSLVLSCIVVFASLEAGVNNNKNSSLVFFGSVADMPFQEYKSKLLNSSVQDMEEDYLGQIHILSKICKTKFRYFNFSMISFLISLSLIIVSSIEL